MPSNHAAIAGGSAVALCRLGRPLAARGIGIALLAAVSRAFVGAHHLHDVIAGLLLGATIGLALLLVRMVSIVRRLRAFAGTRWLVGRSTAPGAAKAAEAGEVLQRPGLLQRPAEPVRSGW